MADSAQGVIGWAGSRRYGGKTLYSFKFDGSDTFYRCGEVNPNISQGDVVSFEYSTDRNNNYICDVNTIKKTGGEAPKSSGGGTGGQKRQSGGGGGTRYQADDDRQKVISLQAATNTAVAITKIAVEGGMLKLGAQGKQFDALKAVVDKLADELVVKYMNAPAHVTSLVETGAVATANDAASEVESEVDDD